MATFTETVEEAGDIALASTKALGRAGLFAFIPLFEFAVLITVGIMIVRLPAMLIRED